MNDVMRLVAIAAAVLACVPAAPAVEIQTVTVGNPGNAGELSGEGAGGYGPDRICGAVSYVYRIGKFEVTAGQYVEFLNAVATTDTYGLYDTNMWSGAYGCKIARTGSFGSYSYAVAGDWADRPVNYVSLGDAARFANWLHNGQPTGAQDLSTTEDGSYYLNGATSNAALLAVVREPDATWVIPSEDEWYKAAYHKNDGATGNYYDYPTSMRSDVYSLGVILCEMLTERNVSVRGLVTHDIQDILKNIVQMEPDRPSKICPTLARQLRGDLDSIIMKCLEKDRTRRYDTANDLAMDIERYLSNEPVCAISPSAAYLLHKLLRSSSVDTPHR